MLGRPMLIARYSMQQEFVTPDDLIEIRRLIVKIFGSQMEASRRLHTAERTVRYWCQNGPPPHVADALRRLAADQISLQWARFLIKKRRGRRDR